MMGSSRSVRWYSLMLCAIALVAGGAQGFAADGPYAVVDRWAIGGQGGWDYLLADPSMHVLYVTHGMRVEVVDTNTGKVVGAITDLKGTHGVAVDGDGRYGYISDGGANAVVVFDRKTYAKVSSIAAGTNPDSIVFEPVTKTVWAFNGRSGDATVIDAASGKVTATIKLSGKPETAAVDGKGKVFVNIESKNSIVRLDAKELKVTAEWPLNECESPSGLAMDTTGRRLFSVCDGKKMAIMNADNGKAIANPAIGDGPDAAGYDAKDQVAFSSNREGTLTVVDAKKATYDVLQTLKTEVGGRTMAFDSGTGRVYITVAKYGPAPAATAAVPHPRPVVMPGSTAVLVIGRK